MPILQHTYGGPFSPRWDAEPPECGDRFRGQRGEEYAQIMADALQAAILAMEASTAQSKAREAQRLQQEAEERAWADEQAKLTQSLFASYSNSTTEEEWAEVKQRYAPPDEAFDTFDEFIAFDVDLHGQAMK